MTSTNQTRGIAIVEMEEKNSDSILIAQFSDCSDKNSLMLPFRSPTTVLLRTTMDSVLLSRNTQKWLKSLYFPNIRGEVTVLQRLRQSGESSLFESLLGTRMLMEAMQILESPWRWTDSEKVSFLGARMYWLLNGWMKFPRNTSECKEQSVPSSFLQSSPTEHCSGQGSPIAHSEYPLGMRDASHTPRATCLVHPLISGPKKTWK